MTTMVVLAVTTSGSFSVNIKALLSVWLEHSSRWRCISREIDQPPATAKISGIN